MDLIEKLNNLGSRVYRRFPEINYGGCCVYARAVAECLLEHNIVAEGIVSSTYAKTIMGGRRSLGHARSKVTVNNTFEWNEFNVVFGHVGLEFSYQGKVWHYDTTGCKPKSDKLDKMPIYRGRLSLEEMQQLTTGEQGWNTSFDKDDIPAVRKMVRKALCKPKTA